MVARDSLFSERIVWCGAPHSIEVSVLHRMLSWVLAVIALVSTLLAIAAGTVGHGATTKLLLFAAWCSTFGLLVRTVPVIWMQAVRFVVTDQHVIWARGSFKRTMQRDGVSFARIHWSRRNPSVGDLELVRAVPTGALRRRLTLALQGVAAPDQVWSIVRGVPTHPGGGSWRCPLVERLDQGETVLWSSGPVIGWRAWVPFSFRRSLNAALGVLCWMMGYRTLRGLLPLAHKLIEAGIPASSLPFVTLCSAVGLTIALLLGMGFGFAYVGILQKPLLDRKTCYWVTDKRILFQRGRKEIHLDRRLVVDIIDRAGLYGGRDVYFILDGPQARAVAAHGAFGPAEGAKGFLPVMRSVEDIDGLRRALAQR